MHDFYERRWRLQAAGTDAGHDLLGTTLPSRQPSCAGTCLTPGIGRQLLGLKGPNPARTRPESASPGKVLDFRFQTEMSD